MKFKNDLICLLAFSVCALSAFLFVSNIIRTNFTFKLPHTQGSDILHLSERNLNALGISNSIDQAKYSLKAAEEIERLKAGSNDAFSWRALNVRLCDFWMIPMLQNPTCGLIWARFFNDNKHLDYLNAEIDEIPIHEFIFTWLICPSRPFYLIASKWNSYTYIDGVITTILQGQYILEVLSFLLFYVVSITSSDKNKKTFVVRQLVSRFSTATILFIWACFLYYVLYWIIPFWLDDVLFLLTVYVYLPLATLVQLSRFAVQSYALLFTSLDEDFLKLNLIQQMILIRKEIAA